MLACTHYPLLLDYFTRLAPWPVRWIDPAPAIARRADQVIAEHFPLGQPSGESFAFLYTSGVAPAPKLAAALARYRAEAPAPEAAGRLPQTTPSW